MSGATCFMWCLSVHVCHKDVCADCHDALLQIPSRSIRIFCFRHSYMSIILWKMLRTEQVKNWKQDCGGSVWYGAGKGMCMWFCVYRMNGYGLTWTVIILHTYLVLMSVRRFFPFIGDNADCTGKNRTTRWHRLYGGWTKCR